MTYAIGIIAVAYLWFLLYWNRQATKAGEAK